MKLEFSPVSVIPGQPTELFQITPVPGQNFFHVARDGRILVNSLEEDRNTAPLSLVLNWTAMIRK